MATLRFDRSVFINCPFDEDYSPVLQAILFCLVYLDFEPRIASESMNSDEFRLAKIQKLVAASKFAIHDLSRCKASKKGEFYRLNMPFELGLDYGCMVFSSKPQSSKKMLILEQDKYTYHKTLSDLSGSDLQAHSGDFQVAVRKVRNWIVAAAKIDAPPAGKILRAYADFQEWYLERQRDAGFSDEDIRDYTTPELLKAMKRWVDLGKPI